MHTRVQWLTPAPLWNELYTQTDKEPFRRPALLRFASDGFMEDMQRVLAKKPADLRGYVARYEDWRRPAAGLDADGSKTIRMYQPVHQRYYLVAASLSCQLPGLPDHAVSLPEKETVTFVLRRRNGEKEFAFVAGDPVTGWAEASALQLMPGEEQLPMFPFPYEEGARTRRIWAGLVPASRKHAYATAQTVGVALPNAPPAEDPRIGEWTRDVFGPWLTMVTTPDPNTDSSLASAFLLLDFVTFLLANLPKVWSGTNMNTEQGALRLLLTSTTNQSGKSLLQAMQEAEASREKIERATTPGTLPVGYPHFHADDVSIALKVKLNASTAKSPLDEAVKAALATTGPIPVSAVRVPSKDPQDPTAGDNYIIRCVYTRPQCGVGAMPDISKETEPFQLVGFFDPDAPARSLQVELPIDVSPRTLSKYDKNVAFAISEQLSKQMGRVKSLKDMAEGNIGGPEAGLGLGWICSFSIPIITICALILLLVIVIALNLVFFWLPFFKICFPVPKLKES